MKLFFFHFISTNFFPFLAAGFCPKNCLLPENNGFARVSPPDSYASVCAVSVDRLINYVALVHLVHLVLCVNLWSAFKRDAALYVQKW